MDVKIPCPCPPKANGEPRHERDTITFRDRLDFHGGMVVRKALTMLKAEDPDSDAADVLAVMTERYMLEGIADWSLVDDKGKRVDCDKAAIRRFMADHEDIVVDHLVEVADGLYQEQVLLPLARKASASSPPSPMEPSTSPETGSEETPRKPSRRSSTSTTRTADITPITRSRDGDSSTSRKSA